jgi:hypothetical protein
MVSPPTNGAPPAPFAIPTPGLGAQHTVTPPPTAAPPPSDDPAIAPQPEGALSRFGNSAAIAAGAMPGSTSEVMERMKSAVQHPLDTAADYATGILKAQRDTANKGFDEFKSGDYAGGAADVLYGGIPLVGPALSQGAHQMASGDVAGGLGTTAGTAAALLMGEGMKVPEPGALQNADLAQAAIAKQAAPSPVAGPKEPIPGAPLTRGEAAGPGLKQSAEQLASKVVWSAEGCRSVHGRPHRCDSECGEQGCSERCKRRGHWSEDSECRARRTRPKTASPTERIRN